EVIVRAVEAKAYVNSKSKHIDRSGSLDERLKRAEAKIASMRERKEAVLSNLCSRYVALKSAGDPAAKQLEHQIENYDSQLCNDNHAATITAVLFLSYRCGLDSVGVSNHLDGRVKPPLVRQILRRCRMIAGEPSTQRVRLSPDDRAARAAMKAEAKEARRLLRAHRAEQLEARRNQRLLDKAARDTREYQRRLAALAFKPDKPAPAPKP